MNDTEEIRKAWNDIAFSGTSNARKDYATFQRIKPNFEYHAMRLIKQSRAEEQKATDKAYKERNLLVATLSKLFPSYLAKHPESDETWSMDWRNIVVISIPVRSGLDRDWRQCTWHIHDSELPIFSHLALNESYIWDGHTMEEKYDRLNNIDV